MTEPIYVDADLISSFLWVGKQYSLVRLYPERIILPKQVLDELYKVLQLKKSIEPLISQRQISTIDILVDSAEYLFYKKLVYYPEPGHKTIGKGEAAVIALAKFNNGIIGSNNLSDISQYITLYQLRSITTAEILVEMHGQENIKEKDIENIWQDMIRKRTYLPCKTFRDYLRLRNR